MLSSIRDLEKKKGVKIPCTLSAFNPTATRSLTLKCVVNVINTVHQDLVVRIDELQSLISGTVYQITLDDFINPKIEGMH